MSNAYAQVVLDAEVCANARQGRWKRTPEWAKVGVLDFQFDSIQYRLKAGETTTLPLPVALHAIRRGRWLEDHRVGPAIAAVRKVADLPSGTVSPTRCTVCGEDQPNIETLSKHLLSHVEFTESKAEATEIDYSSRKGRFPESADVEPVEGVE